MHVLHLVRRFVGSFDRRRPRDVEWVRSTLTSGEFELWSRMAVQDRRHSIAVARRFGELAPAAGRAEVAAALLHDVGKIESDLGTFGRVFATVFGGRTARWDAYRRHEEIGRDLCRRVGSDERTIQLLVPSSDPVFDLIDRADRGR